MYKNYLRSIKFIGICDPGPMGGFTGVVGVCVVVGRLKNLQSLLQSINQSSYSSEVEVVVDVMSSSSQNQLHIIALVNIGCKIYKRFDV